MRKAAARWAAGVGVLAAILLASCGGGGGDETRITFTDVGAGLRGVCNGWLAWGDYDADGDLDLALAGYPGYTRIYQNCGDGLFVKIDAGLPGLSYSSLGWGDYDGDGDIDLAAVGFAGGTSYLGKIYRNDGGDSFNEETNAVLRGMRGCLAWGDYDNDGDLDLALAGDDGFGQVTRLYQNEGGGSFAEIDAGMTGTLGSLAWGDYDGDGDLDLALAGSTSTASPYDPKTDIYENVGGGAFAPLDAGLPGVYGCSLAWGDYDNDGDLDLALAGNAGSSTFICRVYRNEGGVFTDSEADLPGLNACAVAWGDCDSDGDLDLALSGDPGRQAEVYRNDGDGVFASLDVGLEGVLGSALAWGDYDNDGDLDLALAGLSDGGYVSNVYRNDGGVPNAPPSVPSGLSASYTGTGPYDVTFSWTSATDAETPQDGLSYNLRVGTTPGGDEVFSGMASASGWRRIPARGAAQPRASVNAWTLTLPAGTYYWSVQAIDTAFSGSPWASEQTVTVP